MGEESNGGNASRDESEDGNEKSDVSINNRKMSQSSDDWSQRWNGHKKTPLNSYNSWSHWSDQINWPKTGGVETNCIMHGHAQTIHCCPDKSCIMLKFNCWTIFQTNGIIPSYSNRSCSSTAASLTWFETLLNNYKLEYLHLIPLRPVCRLILQFRWWCTLS